jgi:hypothetical protein
MFIIFLVGFTWIRPDLTERGCIPRSGISRSNLACNLRI